MSVAITIRDVPYELLGAPLVTLDQRIAQAPGIRCQVDTQPA
jgi:hypothetical protein